jgi:serine/threonine protein kinase
MMADLRRAAAIDPNYQKQLAQVQMPSNSDILFLFPGEALPGTRAAAAAPAVGRSGKFGAMAGAAALGGLLIAFGLLRLVMDPIKEQVSSVFTKLTRTGPTVSAVEGDTIEPASVGGFVPGLIRGQYEVVREIGAGGMGMVFEGVDKSLGRRVAIKKMRDELRVNPQERARFVIEAKTVAALKHPNIVDIFAIADDGADLFLVFEFVDGKTVHDLVQREGRLPMPEAARVVRAVADALAFAHGKGVIHRDMKPSNIMLDAQGRVKVMDFGIARMAKDALTRYSMTNTIVGTPPYMAPEQEQGQVRRESDVYALAVCAYEMLTGKLPFAGIGAGMLMNKINMAFIPPARAIAGLPDSLDAVFAKALQGTEGTVILSRRG